MHLHKVGIITCSWCHDQQSVVNALAVFSRHEVSCMPVHTCIQTYLQQQGAHRLGRSKYVGCADHALMLDAAAHLHALSMSDACSTLEKCTQADERQHVLQPPVNTARVSCSCTCTDTDVFAPARRCCQARSRRQCCRSLPRSVRLRPACTEQLALHACSLKGCAITCAIQDWLHTN